MKIILFSRPQISHPKGQIEALFGAIEHYGFDFCINREFAATLHSVHGISIEPQQIYDQIEECDLATPQAVMVCYGGDGTLLDGAQRLRGAEIPILGINAGRLGFLTTDPAVGIDAIFECISKGELHISRRAMLTIQSDALPHDEPHLALNEFAIQRLGAAMINIESYIDSQSVATYHGDGVIIATPTGSTAYSLSAGGAILAPEAQCLTISPLAPHNLTMRALVIPDTSVVELRVECRDENAFATIDNRRFTIAKSAIFTIRRSEKSLFLASPHNISFYDTLRNKMMWGVDPRS